MFIAICSIMNYGTDVLLIIIIHCGIVQRGVKCVWHLAPAGRDAKMKDDLLTHQPVGRFWSYLICGDLL